MYKHTILIVDDDIDILEAMQFLLETEGYEVRTTETGDHGTLFEHSSSLPDLIILDVFLSGIDGRHLCKLLKTRDETKKIPILMVSAHPAAEELVKECEADDFLAKPFDMEVLLEKIHLYV